MSKTRTILTFLIALAIVAFMTGTAIASQIFATKEIVDEKAYYLEGETVKFVMNVINPPTNTRTNTIKEVKDILPDGTTYYFIRGGVDPVIVQPPNTITTFYYDFVIPTGMQGVKINFFSAEGNDDSPVNDYLLATVTKGFIVVRPSIDIEKLTNDEDADDPTGPYIKVGDAVTWTYIVTNTGGVDLTGVVVNDDRLGEVGVIGDLAVGASKTLTKTGTAEAGQYGNIGSVKGYYLQTEVNDSDPSHYFGADPKIDIEKATNGSDADDPTGPFILAGDPVIWTYVVKNTGNVDLTGVEVWDDKEGYVGTIGNLAKGATDTLTKSGTAKAGQYENKGTVKGYFGQIEVTDMDPSHYFGAVPSIDIEKATNGFDADDPTGPCIMAGDTVTWTYVVKNTGNVDLTGVAVNDDKLGPIGAIGNLAAGATATLTKTGVAIAGQYANLGSVEGFYASVKVQDKDPSHYFGADPKIDIEKATNGDDADSPTGPYIIVGDQVKWTYVVKNIGNVALTNVVVTDDVLGPIGSVGTLLPDEGVTFEVWKPSDFVGQYVNIGWVEGSFMDIKVGDKDPSHYFGVKPEIKIVKYVWDGEGWDDANSPTGPTLLIGSEVKWRYVVTNPGNVPLTDISVTDNIAGVVPVYVSGDDGDGILELGESWIYEAVGTVIAGQYTNIGKACGSYEQVRYCDEDPANYFGSMNYTGLTPGFWKNHTEPGYWFCYLPADPVTKMFGDTTKYYGLGGLTLLEILSRTIKREESNAPGVLLRAAVAAVLNACHPEINYPMSAEDIIAEVKVALNGGDYAAMLLLKDKLAGYNELEGVEVTKPPKP